MRSKRALELELESLEGFKNPRVEHEQYATPASLAAHLVHLAALNADLDRTVVDLGTGTGILAIGTALAGAERVVGIDLDRGAIEIALANAKGVDQLGRIDWLLGDATRPPICLEEATILMNPPFGAQRGHEHADRAFLSTAAAIGSVSYSVHNSKSESFVESFAADNGGIVTHAFRAEFPIERQFDFHDRERAEISVEVFRIEWS